MTLIDLLKYNTYEFASKIVATKILFGLYHNCKHPDEE